MLHDAHPPMLDATHVDTTGACIDHDRGNHSCAAGVINLSLLTRGRGPDRLQTVLLALFRGPGGPGLHVAYQPDAARGLAAALIKAADDADAANGTVASRQLSAALGRPLDDPAEMDRRVSASQNQPPAPGDDEPAKPVPPATLRARSIMGGAGAPFVEPGMAPVAIAVFALIGAVGAALLLSGFGWLTRQVWP